MLDFRSKTIFFGGSFDPIHLGHLHIAKAAMQKISGANIVFVPAAESPGKKANAPAAQRLQWLKDSLVGTHFQLWDYELTRPGPSYSVDTLEQAHLQGATKEHCYWLLGADAYANFDSWKKSQRIRELTRLLVVNRQGNNIKLHSDDILCEMEMHPASSTLIRAKLSQGEIPEDALPRPVSESLRILSLKSQNPYVIQE
jgi:nicotinate-nucleotide adenylyltransferase